jgi:RNA polymerase sigma-70 factor (ECF subfamily)
MTSSELFIVSDASLERVALVEPDLVARLKDGEPAAVGEVYDAHHAAVRAFAKRLVGDAAAAEDLVHEVFVSLPKVIRSYRGDASLRTFLISVAVNHARHHVRAAARRRATLNNLAELPKSTTRDPESDVERRQLASVLNRALDTLPIEQRVAFVLCEVEELNSREVASVVGVPEATVRTRLFHAKKKLRSVLEKEQVR